MMMVTLVKGLTWEHIHNHTRLGLSSGYRIPLCRLPSLAHVAPAFHHYYSSLRWQCKLPIHAIPDVVADDRWGGALLILGLLEFIPFYLLAVCSIQSIYCSLNVS
jgi:hypothetical protein